MGSCASTRCSQTHILQCFFNTLRVFVGFLCKHPMLSNTHITMLFQYFLGVSREPRGVSRRSMRLSTSLQDVPQASKGFHERSMTLHEVHTEPHKALGASRRLVEASWNLVEHRGASYSLLEAAGSSWKLLEPLQAPPGASRTLVEPLGASWRPKRMQKAK